MDHKFQYFTGMLNKKTFKTVFGKHELLIPEKTDHGVESSYEFVLSESYLGEWNSLFNSEDSESIVPYTYYWPGVIKFSMEKLLCGLGMKMKYALHLGQETEYFRNYVYGALYNCKTRLVDICHLNHNRIILITENLIKDDEGNTVLKSTDYTFMPEIGQEAVDKLNASTSWNKHSLEMLTNGLKKKKPLFAEAAKAKKKATYYCPKNLWWVFGSVSGGTTLTHGFWLVSKLIRKEEPFMQGMCSGNIVLKFLSQHLGEDLEKFTVFFNNKLFFPQTVELRYDDEHFELYDENNNMVTFGTRKVRPSAKKRKDEKIKVRANNEASIINIGV